MKHFEIRDPVHGFVRYNELERDIINHPAFQRLRRIRQLAFTDMVYPGAMHTRFEHSLGAMHVATRLFRTVCERSREILESEYQFEEAAKIRWLQIVRLAALLHDVGHTPFSHNGEDLLPLDQKGKQYTHEAYSAAILRHELAGTIENNRHAENLGIRASDVERVFEDAPSTKPALVWKAFISGQMDADRMDYLLRDSHHAGVAYGKYDLDRVASTVEFCEDPDTGGHELGIGDDGTHAVEGLLIARYMMFTQVYFHKTRSIFDYHLAQALKKLLEPHGGRFPPPTTEDIRRFLEWDDWRVLGAVAQEEGGEHGRMLVDRDHYRCVCETSETPSEVEIEKFESAKVMLSTMNAVAMTAAKSWYQPKDDILVMPSRSGGDKRPLALSSLSGVVAGLKPINRMRLYVPRQSRDAANAALREGGFS
ncbi:MAG TPA: HD domain-containing protein [Rhizomicrobium sp.]|nr:HD domain-containing protein [Rhizomicrobium sp.]